MKINWLKAEKEYISDESVSQKDISAKYGVALKRVNERSQKRQWIQRRAEAIEKARQIMMETIPESMAAFNTRKFLQGKTVSDRGVKVLEDPKLKIGGKTAGELIATGFKLQTEALGLDNPKTQINIQNNTYISMADFVAKLKEADE
jgi:hypothetical protein